MKRLIIACSVFLSTFVSVSLAQQTTATADRQLTPEQAFAKHQAQYESFKSLVIRFEVAWQEADAQSMADLKDVLTKMVAEYNATAHPSTETEAKQLERSQQKANIHDQLKKLPISAEDKALGPKAEQLQQHFNQYLRLMEADILAHHKALGQ